MALYSLYLINKAGGLIYNVVRTTFLDMSPPLLLLLNSTVPAFVTSHAPSLYTPLSLGSAPPFPLCPSTHFPFAPIASDRFRTLAIAHRGPRSTFIGLVSRHPQVDGERLPAPRVHVPRAAHHLCRGGAPHLGRHRHARRRHLPSAVPAHPNR